MVKSPERPPPRQAALDAIRKLTRAWIRKDADGMAEQLTDDITELGPAYAAPLIGKQQFFRKYRAYLRGSLHIQDYRFLRPRLVVLTSRLVLAHFSYRMTTCRQGYREHTRGQESMLVEKTGRRWRVKFIHWHRDS
jgi:ketosteroid isomerase-like protein